MWPSRLRWRLRGAWMWPGFAVLTVLDGLLLHARPIAGGGTGVFDGMLLAAFFNVVTVAVLAPIAGALLRRRRRDLPKLIATDYAGAALLVAVTGALMAGGVLHRPAVLEQRRDFHAQAAAVRTTYWPRRLRCTGRTSPARTPPRSTPASTARASPAATPTGRCACS
jgi:hypothetical protein